MTPKSWLPAACLVVAIATGCGAGEDAAPAAAVPADAPAAPDDVPAPPADAAVAVDTPPAADEAPPADRVEGWVVERTASAIDGEVLAARRTFRFPDQGTEIDIRVSCVAGKPGIALASYVGSRESPDAFSAFDYEFTESRSAGNIIAGTFGEIVGAPVGRVRFNGLEVRPLQQNFVVGAGRENEAEFIGLGLMDVLSIQSAHGMVGDAMAPGAVNFGAIVRGLFPFAAEFSNGRGTFEVQVDDAPEVLEVLGACGGNDPPFPGMQPKG